MTSELLDKYYHLKEYMRENNFIISKFSLTTDELGSISSSGVKVDDMVESLEGEEQIINANLEFISRR